MAGNLKAKNLVLPKFNVADEVYCPIPVNGKNKYKSFKCKINDILEGETGSNVYFLFYNDSGKVCHALIDEEFIFATAKESNKFIRTKKNQLTY